MEITQLENQTKELTAPVNSLIAGANDIQIKSDADLETASFKLKEISTLKNKVEAQRKAITDPIYRSYKNANEFFNRFLNPLKQADTIIRQKMSEYRTIQERERQKKQAELDKLFQKEQERINKKAEKLGVEAPVLAAPTVVEPEAKVGATKFKTVWDFTVEDISKIPVEYLMVDLAKVRRAVYDGTRQIPGIKIFTKEQVTL